MTLLMFDFYSCGGHFIYLLLRSRFSTAGVQPLSITEPGHLELPGVAAVSIQPSPPKWKRINPAEAKSITVNKDRFSPPASDRTPQLSPVWLAALKGVDCVKEKIWDHPNRILFKGFALPDPLMLTSPDIQKARLERHLIIWLLLRPGLAHLHNLLGHLFIPHLACPKPNIGNPILCN